MKAGHEKDYDERPWGNYRVLYRDAGMWVKRIEVRPGHRFSLQKHVRRRETWIITDGQGVVRRSDEVKQVSGGSVVTIGLGEVHRMENNGLAPLVFIEVAIGESLSEDDIIRIEDDYQRE